MLGLLGSQDLTEGQKVDILLGALAGEAKHQINVTEESERDQVRKVFAYLDTLYGDRTPTPVLRSRYFSCMQRPEETSPAYILRLGELFSRVQRGDPKDAPSEMALRDQLLLGLQEGPLAQALKVYVHRDPDQGFAAIKDEALLLDAKCGSLQPEVTGTSINGSRFWPLQDGDWKETLKREILEDVKVQITGLTQELLKELFQSC